jgi:hypothetical protein
VAGNIGGVGVGFDFAWELAGLISYRFRLWGKGHYASFVFGYRPLYEDYEEGGGTEGLSMTPPYTRRSWG